MGIHKGKPWREVVHIDTQKGPRGGLSWVLTLECGHTAFRHKDNPTAAQLGARLIGELISFHGKRPRPALRTAPEKVRCLWCPSTPSATSPRGDRFPVETSQ